MSKPRADLIRRSAVRQGMQQEPRSGVATVSAFLTVGFSFDDEREYMHLNPVHKGLGFGVRD